MTVVATIEAIISRDGQLSARRTLVLGFWPNIFAIWAQPSFSKSSDD